MSNESFERIPPNAVFHQAWHPGETPHLIKSTKFLENFGKNIEQYNLEGAQQDRSLKQHQQKLGFTIDAIPQSESVLVIGSGVTRHFERELYGVRPDLMIVSIDPLLKYGVQERIREAIRMGAYSDHSRLDRYGYGVKFPYEIMDDHPFYLPGAVAGSVAVSGLERQGLPFRDASFGQVLALHSVPQYSRLEEVPFMLSEIVRVMKPGATARFYPFFSVDLPILNTVALQGVITEPEITAIGRFHAGDIVSDWIPEHRRVVFQRKRAT